MTSRRTGINEGGQTSTGRIGVIAFSGDQQGLTSLLEFPNGTEGLDEIGVREAVRGDPSTNHVLEILHHIIR